MEVVGEFFSLTFKVQNIINEDVILKGGVNDFLFYFSFVDYFLQSVYIPLNFPNQFWLYWPNL